MRKLKCVLIVLTAIISTIPYSIVAQNNMSLTRTVESEHIKWGNCPEFMPDSCKIAVLQGDPSKPNTDIFFKMKGNSSIPNHWHNSAERMILVSGKMEVDYRGQSPKTLTFGSYAYGPPEKPHTASCLSNEPCILFIAFNKPVDAFPVN